MTMCLINQFEIDGVRIDESAKTTLPTARRIDPQYIEGYSVVECDLKKELLKPSEFTFTLRHYIPGQKSLDVIDKLIGKPVICHVITQDKQGRFDSQLHFNGIIDKVLLKGINITCIAYSEDCKLQGPAKCRCFYDMKVADVVKAVLSEYKIKNQIEIQSDIKDLVFPFVVQYNESDYDFLIRLAKRFGAFFYYRDVDSKSLSKNCLIFGKLPSDTVKSIDSSKAVSYELEAGNSNYRFVAYHGEKDLPFISPGFDFGFATSSNKLTKLAIDASTEYTSQDKKYYIDYPYGLTKDPKQDEIELHNIISLISDADRMVTCKFICYRFDVQVGDVVTVDNNSVLVVIAAHLTWDCSGSPQNEITAMRLPYDVFNINEIIAPYVDFNAYPKSSAQRAIVINNVDPLKMGRVQVLFNWQSVPADDNEQKKLPWIRIAQPYGGGKADKGQGCYILPEIGEEVMVGFEHDNLEKPYVIGTLYHNSDTADNVQMPETTWVETDQANKKNEIKAFRTKKGHTIEIHDVDGDNNFGFIRIYGNEKKDQPNYDIVLSTDPIKTGANRDQVYKVKSADNQLQDGEPFIKEKEYEVKELRLMVRSNGGDIVLDAGEGDLIMNAKNIRIHAAGERTALIEGKDVVKVVNEQWLETKNSASYIDYNHSLTIKNRDEYKASALNLGVRDDIVITSKNLTSTSSNKTMLQSDKEMEINAKSGLTINGGTKVDLSGTTITLDAKTEAQLNGQSAVKINGNLTHIKGTSIELDASTIGKRSGKWADV